MLSQDLVNRTRWRVKCNAAGSIERVLSYSTSFVLVLYKSAQKELCFILVQTHKYTYICTHTYTHTHICTRNTGLELKSMRTTVTGLKYILGSAESRERVQRELESLTIYGVRI